MNLILRPYSGFVFFLLFLFGLNNGIFAQQWQLILKAKDTSNATVLSAETYAKSHKTKALLNLEIQAFLNRLKRKGYFTARLIDTSVKNYRLSGTIDLGKKTNWIHIKADTAQQRRFGISPITKIRVIEFDKFKVSLQQKLLELGTPFSEIRFLNYSFEADKLRLEFSTTQSKSRKIDKVIVKGYQNFPSAFTKNYLQLDRLTSFSKASLRDLENRISNLGFVKSTKTPELLFKQDSTILYIYLEKKKNNTLDALVNLANDQNNTLQFNGIVDMDLNNILDKGEQLKIYWNRVGADRAEFNFKVSVPYLFNSSTSGALDLNIYRQDSTFLNTSFQIKLWKPLGERGTVGLKFRSTSSSQIEDFSSNLSLADFTKSQVGSFITFEAKKRMFNGEKQWSLHPQFNLYFRKTDLQTTQWGMDLSALYQLGISEKSILHLRQQTRLLFSENYLLNELFRIGGINSLRGFDEQALFTSKYSCVNSEYRYYTTTDNYLHTIVDFAWLENASNQGQFLHGLGLGYVFKRKNNLIHLGYVIGGDSNTALNLNNSRLLVKFLSIF